MICLALALALALAPAPVPLPAPTLKGLQPMPQKGCSDITWQRVFRYLASDNRSRPDDLLSDYGPGRMVFFLNAGNPGIQNEPFIKTSIFNWCLCLDKDNHEIHGQLAKDSRLAVGVN